MSGSGSLMFLSMRKKEIILIRCINGVWDVECVVKIEKKKKSDLLKGQFSKKLEYQI